MIPIIDFSVYSLEKSRSSIDVSEIQFLAEELCQIFTGIGFVYLKNHGIPSSKIVEIFEVSKTFFDQPLETKRKYARPDGSDHGWHEMEREKLGPDRPAADLKEAFNFRCSAESSVLPNDVIPNFQDSFTHFSELCTDLALRVLDLICIGLNIDRDFFRNCHSRAGDSGNMTTLRSLYYPPVTEGIKPGQVRCGEHCDYGSITLLFQDEVGGLQVKPRDTDYIPANPVPGTVLINLGEMTQRWTADKLLATEHRVMMSAEEEKRARQSLAFFVNPNDDVIIECLDKSDKYPPMSCIDYLNYRLSSIL